MGTKLYPDEMNLEIEKVFNIGLKKLKDMTL